ncbi:MAG: GNAT family N-acetyltransferase [Caldilineaceae bacterium]|nr:GNAT family N-acetyltransferase [Caldilineaceae bacterium]
MINMAPDYSHYYWQTDKIRLRAFTADDAGYRFAESLDSISREEFNIGIETPTTVELQKEWLEKYGGCKEINGAVIFAVETNKAEISEQEYVGLVTIHSINERHGKFSFSIFIDRPHRKQGHAEDAVQLILKYGFLERRLHKCNSGCASYNNASIELHRKLGFVQEGTLRQEYFYNGTHHDELVFGLLLDEYNVIHEKG